MTGAFTLAERLDAEILNVRLALLEVSPERRAELRWQLNALRAYRVGAAGRQERAFVR